MKNEEPNGCIGINGVSDPNLNEVQLNQSKKETLEEVAEKMLWTEAFTQLFPKWNSKDVLEQREQAEIKAFIQGAKWQQERSYSEEEVENICGELCSYFIGGDTFDLKEWFEQFKNK